MEEITQGIIDEKEVVQILLRCLNALNTTNCLSRKLVRDSTELAQKLVDSKDNNEYSQNLHSLNLHLTNADTKECENESPSKKQ